MEITSPGGTKGIYTGEFDENGNRNGYGITVYKTGHIYEGYFENNKRKGFVRLIANDGGYM